MTPDMRAARRVQRHAAYVALLSLLIIFGQIVAVLGAIVLALMDQGRAALAFLAASIALWVALRMTVRWFRRLKVESDAAIALAEEGTR